MDNYKYCFEIENGINTSYISTLFTALFLNKTDMDKLLYENVSNIHLFYLQEMIKRNFVEKIRNNRSIELSTIAEIRNLCIIFGWAKNDNPSKLYDINDFYIFLLEQLKIKFLHFELCLEPITVNTTSKELIDIIDFNSVSKDDLCLSFHINRQNNRKVDIMKSIKIIIDNKKNKFNINAIICFSGCYYAIINIKEQWYYFDEKQIPSIRCINIKMIKDKIMQDCIMLLYVRNL